jgi:carbonic anhydrase/acetyltransferase-like protein (isoleucine patch superfamily)
MPPAMPSGLVLPFEGRQPRLGPDVFVAPGAAVIGDVTIGARSSIWFGAVLRGDDHFIRLGDEVNIQDNVVIHEGRGELPAIIGDRTTIGHGAILHGCTVGSLCIVGLGAKIMDGCEIGERCLIAAGALLAPGTRVPPGTLVMGAPARVKRDLRPDELAHLEQSAANYVSLGRRYLRAFRPTP